ncbi:hypothetical protein SBADM41S_04225 [Streptomyces badius]
MGDEQQPRHRGAGLGEERRRAVTGTGHIGQRGAHRADARHPGPARADLAAAAQYVETHRAQRARDRAAGRP